MTDFSIAPRLKAILTERHLSLNELSRLSSVSVATLSRILNEQSTPSVDNACKIAQALKLPLSALLPEEPLAGGAGPVSALAPEKSLSAIFVLEDTDHTPESAMAMLTNAARGSWVGSSTDIYLDPSLPQPTATSAAQVGSRRLQAEVRFPHGMLEGGSIPGLLSVAASGLTGTGARLLDLRVPEVLIRTFNGPAFGMRGLRDSMNKHGRPLLSSTIRPMHGLSPRLYGRAVHECLVGGVDLTCDPTLLHSIPSNQWRERFRFVAEACHAATSETNEFKSHAANITAATYEEMLERATWAKDLELATVLIDAAAVGWAAVQSLAAWCRRNELILCAMGGRAINGDMLSEQVQAKLLRLAGCDIVSTGSPLRGNVSNRRYVTGVLNALRDESLPLQPDAGYHVSQPMAGLNASAPAVGGGHNPWHFPRLLDAIGDHAIIQCGGSVMGHPWGSTAGAVANRTALEALVQARGEGLNLNIEGRNILQKTSRFSPELKAALEHWQEGAFLFGVISGEGGKPDNAIVTPPTGGQGNSPSPTITPFRRPTEKDEE